MLTKIEWKVKTELLSKIDRKKLIETKSEKIKKQKNVVVPF